MFNQVIKLLKNIQFWTILSSIAAIITLIVQIWPSYNNQLTIRASYNSLTQRTDTTINVKGDSLVIMYAIPMLSFSPFHIDYCIVSLPISIYNSGTSTVSDVIVTGFSKNFIDSTIIYDRHNQIKFVEKETWPRFHQTVAQFTYPKVEFSTFEYKFNSILHHQDNLIPLNLIFYNPLKINGDTICNKDGSIFDEFYFDLTVTEPHFKPHTYSIHTIGIIYYGDKPTLKDGSAPYENTFDSLANIYPNSLAITLNTEFTDNVWHPILDSDGRKYAKYSSGDFWHKNKVTTQHFSFKSPSFSTFWDWNFLILLIILIISPFALWIPELKVFYNLKKTKYWNNSNVYKSKQCEINNSFWLYAYWIGAIVGPPLAMCMFLYMFTNIFLII